MTPLRRNFIFNILDGGFFGLGLGFTSFVTVLPLFVSQLTDSAVLIGLIPAIHAVGWQLPQLLTANRVTRLGYYKPMVLWMTIHERLPYLGLALVAWAVSSLDPRAALALTYLLLVWQGLGGGFTATAWQSMIAKIIPGRQLGIFFGLQSSAANMFLSVGAIGAGIILERAGAPFNFALCFLITGAAMTVSWVFLALVREERVPPTNAAVNHRDFWNNLVTILARDVNFRWFLIVRMLAQLAVMAFAFYTVYAVHHFSIGAETAGLMTAVFAATQIIANPALGWLGDRWSHRGAMEIGALAATLSAMLAWLAPTASWFYLVFILAGIANVAVWTLVIPLTLQFGREAERPAYIGLANTLVAPVTFLAPILGGWLADSMGYSVTFLTSAFGGLVTLFALHAILRDPTTRHPVRVSND